MSHPSVIESEISPIVKEFCCLIRESDSIENSELAARLGCIGTWRYLSRLCDDLQADKP